MERNTRIKGTDFVICFFEIIPPLFRSLSTVNIPVDVTDATPNKGGRPPRLSSSQMVTALVFHVMQGGKTFSRSVARAYGMQLVHVKDPAAGAGPGIADYSPRKVRQPVRKWPRLMKYSDEKGPIECEIRKS